MYWQCRERRLFPFFLQVRSLHYRLKFEILTRSRKRSIINVRISACARFVSLPERFRTLSLSCLDVFIMPASPHILSPYPPFQTAQHTPSACSGFSLYCPLFLHCRLKHLGIHLIVTANNIAEGSLSIIGSYHISHARPDPHRAKLVHFRLHLEYSDTFPSQMCSIITGRNRNHDLRRLSIYHIIQI